MANQNFDSNAQYELYIENYSRKVEVIDTDTYIALAVPGSAEASAVWQVQKIDTNGSRYWADGNTNFDNVGSSPLSGLTFSL